MSEPEASSVRIVLHNFRSEVEAPVGTTLLEAVQAAGLGLDAECGGRGTCGGCRVRFLEGTPPPAPEDHLLLEPAAIKDGWRLARQVVVKSDCRHFIPDMAPLG